MKHNLEILDHIYFVVNKELLKTIVSTMKGVESFEHRKTKVKGSQWEGCYIYTKKGCYIEFVLENENLLKKKDVGIYFRSLKGISIKDYLLKYYPEIPWKINSEHFENGKLWFENIQYKFENGVYLRNFDYSEIGEERRESLYKKGKEYEYVQSIKVDVNKETFEKLRENFKWSDLQLNISQTKVEIFIPQNQKKEDVLKLIFVKNDISKNQQINIEFLNAPNQISDRKLIKNDQITYIKEKNKNILKICNA